MKGLDRDDPKRKANCSEYVKNTLKKYKFIFINLPFVFLAPAGESYNRRAWIGVLTFGNSDRRPTMTVPDNESSRC